MDLCDGCGAEVVVVPAQVGSELATSVRVWGVPVTFDRLMVATDRGLQMVQHRCRDYWAWHQPASRLDPSTVDVPHGWRPRVAS